MRNQKHTAEPWEAVTPCPGECCWHIQQVGNDNPMDMINNPEMSHADARRIVACVNACAGLREDELVHGVVPANNFILMREQRDKLLEACHDALNNLPPDGDCAALIRKRVATVTAAS